MKKVLRSILPVAACAALACGQQAKKTTAPPPTGAAKSKVTVTSNARPHTPADLQAYTGTICMTLDLTPYAFVNGAQTSPGVSGPTVTIHTTPTATDTDAVLACTSGGATDGLSDNFNWGYTVSAYDFGDCSTYTQPDGTVVYSGSDGINTAGTPAPAGSPANGIGYPTNPFPTSPIPFQQGMICNEDTDSELPLVVNIDLTESNGTGYVDVATTINDTGVQVGCKTADFGTTGDGILHFGSTTTYNTGNYAGTGTAPLALTGVGFADAIDGGLQSLPQPPAPDISQFAGTIVATPDPINGPQDGAYINGTLSQSVTPASSNAGTWDVVQAFLPRPSDWTEANGTAQWCSGTLVPECDTTIPSGAQSTDSPTQVHTATELASAVITLPSGFWLIANVGANGTDLNIVSGGTAAFSDPSIAPVAPTAWTAETASVTLDFPAVAPAGTFAAISGVAIDPATPGNLIVTVSNGDGTSSVYSVFFSTGKNVWTWTKATDSQITSSQGQTKNGCQAMPVAKVDQPLILNVANAVKAAGAIADGKPVFFVGYFSVVDANGNEVANIPFDTSQASDTANYATKTKITKIASGLDLGAPYTLDTFLNKTYVLRGTTDYNVGLLLVNSNGATSVGLESFAASSSLVGTSTATVYYQGTRAETSLDLQNGSIQDGTCSDDPKTYAGSFNFNQTYDVSAVRILGGNAPGAALGSFSDVYSTSGTDTTVTVNEPWYAGGKTTDLIFSSSPSFAIPLVLRAGNNFDQNSTTCEQNNDSQEASVDPDLAFQAVSDSTNGFDIISFAELTATGVNFTAIPLPFGTAVDTFLSSNYGTSLPVATGAPIIAPSASIAVAGVCSVGGTGLYQMTYVAYTQTSGSTTTYSAIKAMYDPINGWGIQPSSWTEFASICPQ